MYLFLKPMDLAVTGCHATVLIPEMYLPAKISISAYIEKGLCAFYHTLG